MAAEILALAVIEANEGKERECLEVLREFYTMLGSKNYSRDLLYRDTRNAGTYINLRYWASEEARTTAHEDPEVHRFWRRLGEICTINNVYERLEQLI